MKGERDIQVFVLGKDFAFAPIPQRLTALRLLTQS